MSAGHCSPQAQLHLQRLLENMSPQRRARSHLADADNGSVSAKSATPQSRITYQQLCLDELQCLCAEEGRVRQGIEADGVADSMVWCTAFHALLRWCCTEEQRAEGIWRRLHQGDQHDRGGEHQLLGDAVRGGGSDGGGTHPPSRITTILLASCKRIEEAAEQRRMAAAAMAEWQRRLDVVSSEAASERDTLALALRDSDERYEALLQESQDALHASRCAGDEVDYWEETATLKEKELLSIASDLASLLDATSVPPEVQSNAEPVALLLDDVVQGLREQPQASTSHASCVALRFKLSATQVVQAESMAFASICIDWLACVTAWLHTSRGAETASNEAFDETVVLLEAQQLHRTFLERKIHHLEDVLASADEKRLKEVQVHETEMHAVWDLLVKTQEQQSEAATALTVHDDRRPIAGVDAASQTVASAQPSSRRRGASFAADPLLIDLNGWSVNASPTVVAAKRRLADVPIGLYAFSMRFEASKYPLPPPGGLQNDSRAWSAVTLEVDLFRMELRVIPVKSSTRRSSGCATPQHVVAHDILSVSRCMDDPAKLSVVLSQGKPLTFYLAHAFARERCLELLRTMQASDAQQTRAPVFAPCLLPTAYDADADECPNAEAVEELFATSIVADGSLSRQHQMTCGVAGNLILTPLSDAPTDTVGVPEVEDATAVLEDNDVRPVGSLTVTHAASHWQGLCMVVVCSSVSVAHPIPLEMEADATIRRDVDVLVLALHVAPARDAETESVDDFGNTRRHDDASDEGTADGLEMRPRSPGADVEQAVASTTIVTKALHGFMCADKPLSFVMALVAEEDGSLFVMLVRKALIPFMQHLNFLSAPAADVAASRSGIFLSSNGSMDASAGCNARISFSVHETSFAVCVLPRRRCDADGGGRGSGPYYRKAYDQYGYGPQGSASNGASLCGVPPAEGTAPLSVDLCCSSHYLFVVQPDGASQGRDITVPVPVALLRHYIVTRGAHIALLSPAASTAEHCHVSTFATTAVLPTTQHDCETAGSATSPKCVDVATRRTLVPLHRVRCTTMRSHATILDGSVPQGLNLAGAAVTGAPLVATPSSSSSLLITFASLVLNEVAGSPHSIISSLQWRQYVAPPDDDVVVALCSEFGAAPLTLTLTPAGGRHVAGTFGWEGQAPLDFVVPCKQCVSQKLLFVVQSIDSTASALSLHGSAATTLASWCSVKGGGKEDVHDALLACRTPWFVRGVHVGDLQLRGRWL